MPTTFDPTDLDTLASRPTFRCRVYNGDDELVATIVATSTADALATFLDRLPPRGRDAYAMTARSLRRKDADAFRRWHRHGNTQAGRSQLVCPRYIGHPDDSPVFYCCGAVEMPDPELDR